ncbi:hypothetical protein AB6A40_011859, partial [Gnathostoma spinigerum]
SREMERSGLTFTTIPVGLATVTAILISLCDPMLIPCFSPAAVSDNPVVENGWAVTVPPTVFRYWAVTVDPLNVPVTARVKPAPRGTGNR